MQRHKVIIRKRSGEIVKGCVEAVPELGYTKDISLVCVPRAALKNFTILEVDYSIDGLTESLTFAIDAKDQYTRNHSEEAAIYAEALGKACQLTQKQLELVRMAAKLHDLGKIGIPAEILKKPGPLNAEEWKIMREHPALGAKILQTIEPLKDLVPIVQCHHERWNGSGYPAGLKGTQIPLEARLIAVIDSFLAIVSKRPYKPAMPVSYALEQLRAQAGISFDPDLVERFCSLLNVDGNIRLPETREASESVLS